MNTNPIGQWVLDTQINGAECDTVQLSRRPHLVLHIHLPVKSFIISFSAVGYKQVPNIIKRNFGIILCHVVQHNISMCLLTTISMPTTRIFVLKKE